MGELTAQRKGIDEVYGLEPVFEPGDGGHELEQFVDVRCPYCAEVITIRVDCSAGPQSCVEDCQVCCQAIALTVAMTEEGTLREVSVERLS